MLIGKMRKTLREDESGQAILLAALSMMILALSVMTTIQLGHAIDQRIQLQNAADNSAFSSAAVVARSLNFISFVNRTMVSHYVSMMAFQSIISFITGFQTLFSMLADMMQSMSAIACMIAGVCQLCIGVPIVGIACAACRTAFTILSKALEAAAKVVYTLLESTWQAVDALDLIIAKAVQVLSLLNNKGMYLVSKGIKEATGIALTADLASNFATKIVEETAGVCNDAGIGTAYKAAMSAFNGTIATGAYKKLFDKKSEDIPEGGTEYDGQNYNDTNKTQKAERLMAELANATRTGPGGGAYDGLTWETSRGWDDKSLLSKVGFDFAGTTRLVKSQDCARFTQNTANCNGGGFSGGGGAPNVGAITGDCQNKQNACQSKNSAYQTAQSACDSATSSYNSCMSGGGDPPPNCSSQQSNMNSKCDDADDKREERDDTCEDAQDACDKLSDPDSMGGGGQAADENFSQKQYLWTTGAQGTTQFTQGGALSAAERVKPIGLALISGGGAKIVGVQSLYGTMTSGGKTRKSFHCRMEDKKNDRTQFVTMVSPSGPCPDYAVTKQTKCFEENERHKWYGISKYITFNADSGATNTMFNQLSFWSLLNKSPEKARLSNNLAFGFDGKGKFVMSDTWGGKMNGKDVMQGKSQGELDRVDQIGLNDYNGGAMMKGLNAYSRAQVYYHRPGAWTEPPNLFNPFWRAKLAPVSRGLSSVLGAAGGIGGPVGDIISNAITH